MHKKTYNTASHSEDKITTTTKKPKIFDLGENHLFILKEAKKMLVVILGQKMT